MANVDSPRPQKLHIKWEMRTITDDVSNAQFLRDPTSMDEGFWPSTDPEHPGYTPNDYEKQLRSARGRFSAFKGDHWRYVGVVARAELMIPIGQGSFRLMTLDSAGLWGIESSSTRSYLESVYEDEQDNLLAELRTMGLALTSGDFVDE